jgi:CheY-like chemotaxis protein
MTTIESQRAGAAGSPGHRILLVDDNADLAQSLKELLEHDGNQVAMVTDPLAAFELARRTSPEICILDIQLPNMDGYELARRLRELPATKDAVFIALTGYGWDYDPRRSREAGFAHHLLKPVDTARLTSLIASVPSSRASVPDAARSGSP